MIRKLLGIYLLIINIIAFIMYGADKRKAIKHKWRIPEATLLVYALVGGSIGAIFGMKVFHHKTKVWYFKYLVPLMMILQVSLLACLFYKGII